MGIHNVLEVEEPRSFGPPPMLFQRFANWTSYLCPPHNNDEVFIGINAVKKLFRRACFAERTLCKVINNNIHELRLSTVTEWLEFIGVGSDINKSDREQLPSNELLHHPEDISLCL
jgi:hypothetical protein